MSMRKIVLLLLMYCLIQPLYANKTVIKLATLAPDGSEWYYKLVELGEKWEDATEGRVKLRIYPGGVIGDERDMIRKMRIGQIHGAAITAEGLSELNPDFYMFFVPLLFENYGEVDFIRGELRDELITGIRSNGFELMMMTDVGWVYWFTTNSIKKPDDLKSSKIFNWAGDYKFSEIWEKAGFQSVPLSSIDILPGLQTGLIDAIAINPQFSLANQMFGVCNHMLDLKWGLLTGGIVIDSRIFNRIDPKDRKIIQTYSKVFEEQFQKTFRFKDKNAINVMRQYDLQVTHLNKDEKIIWNNAVKSWYPNIRNIFTNPEIFDKVVELKAIYKDPITDLDDTE